MSTSHLVSPQLQERAMHRAGLSASPTKSLEVSVYLTISLEVHANMLFPNLEVVLERLMLLSIMQHAHNTLVIQLIVVTTRRKDRAAYLFRLEKAASISQKSMSREWNIRTII
jgi:hypothetical protein